MVVAIVASYNHMFASQLYACEPVRTSVRACVLRSHRFKIQIFRFRFCVMRTHSHTPSADCIILLLFLSFSSHARCVHFNCKFVHIRAPTNAKNSLCKHDERALCSHGIWVILFVIRIQVKAMDGILF